MTDVPDPGFDDSIPNLDDIADLAQSEQRRDAAISLSLSSVNTWIRRAEQSYKEEAYEAAAAAGQIATAYASLAQAQISHR
jgi:hypothetical protein